MSEAIPSWARVGAKVVCVDARPGTRNGAGGLVEGAEYTLSHVYVSIQGNAACKVTAFPNGRLRLSRFRPLVSQADDIATHFSQFLDTRAPELV